LTIILFAHVAETILPGRSTRLVLASSILPLGLTAADMWLATHQAIWREPHPTLATAARWGGMLLSLPVLLGIVPASVVAALSPPTPFLVGGGGMVSAPPPLIVLAGGWPSLRRRDRRWVVLALLLAGVHGASVRYFKTEPVLRDYKALAARWVPHIEETDLIFVHGRGHPYDWAVAPIYYYMNARRYHYVGKSFAEAVRNSPRSRVWVLSLQHAPAEREALEALAGRRLRQRIEATGMFAELYVADGGVQ